MTEYSINLYPFYESVKIRPLLNGHIVKHADRNYRVERWFTKIKEDDVHCYVFVDITMNTTRHKVPFAKKPSDIDKMLKEKKLHVISFNP